MNRIKGKTVLITGASAGIGEASARAFASFGADLILCGRREDRLTALKTELEGEHDVRVRTQVLDVRDREAVEAFASELEEQGAVPDILLNNAGKALGFHLLHEGLVEDWEEMIDTNVKGLLYVDRAVVPLMTARGRGTVVHIGSIAGRQVYPGGNVYCASKSAVRALTEGLRIDLLGTGVRVTSVDPGLVESEFSQVRFHGDHERAEAVYRGLTPLTGDDIAEIVVFAATRADHVDIAEVLVLPVDQAGANFLHRGRS